METQTSRLGLYKGESRASYRVGRTRASVSGIGRLRCPAWNACTYMELRMGDARTHLSCKTRSAHQRETSMGNAKRLLFTVVAGRSAW